MNDIILDIISRALAEDIGPGDVTTEATVKPGKLGKAVVIAKEDMVLAGLDVFKRVFLTLDDRVKISFKYKDRDNVKKGAAIAELRGPMRPLLKGERVALNLLQRMCGIATLTAEFVQAVKGNKAVILDTRKTTPGLRVLEKYAVTVGGGKNHRFGLYDMALIKDNHIAAAGGIKRAVKAARKALSEKMRVEVECATLDDVREALEAGADIIMLDNMTLAQMRSSVKLVSGHVPVEASGNMDLVRVRSVAETGVDYISVGALTHSARAMDISMKVK